MKPYVSVSDVLSVLSHSYQSSQPSETLQLKGERNIRRCDEPSYTVRTGVPTAIIPATEPVGEVASISDVTSRRLTTDELLQLQTFPSVMEIADERVTAQRRLIGNAVPVQLAESIALALPVE